MRGDDVVEDYYSSEVGYDEDGNELLDDALVPEGEYYEIEEEILNRLSIEAALARLALRDRTVVQLVYRYCAPVDYVGMWPPTMEDVAEYQARYETRPRVKSCVARSVSLCDASVENTSAASAVTRVRERHRQILAQWERAQVGDCSREVA
jgi:hypothetical protein